MPYSRIASTTNMAVSPFDGEYDFPVPSSSKLVSHSHSSNQTRHHRRRSHSPNPTKHIPSTRASDISRLLDPSYSSIKTRSASNPTNAYVDHHGDLHDPDFRHFPAVSTHPKLITRPRWEITDPYAVDDDDDEDEDRVRAFTIHRPASPLRRHRDSSATTTTTAYHSSFPHSTFTAVPTSFDSDETILEDDVDQDESKCPITKAKKSRRLSKAPILGEAAADFGEVAHEKSHSSGGGGEYVPTEAAQDQDWTCVLPSFNSPFKSLTNMFSRPTCTQSLRRQWQSIALSFRFRIFRAQRKVKRTLSMT